MRRFLASAWFPVVICLVLAGSCAAAFAVLRPDGSDINQSRILDAMKIAGWAAGPVIALLSLLLIGFLNLLRRLCKARRVSALHPVVVLLGLLPWLIMGWQLAGEPPFTQLARGVTAFIGRPMLWGSLVAALFTLILSIPLLLPSKRR